MYGNKKIANIEDLPDAARVNENEHNIYQLWRIILGKQRFAPGGVGALLLLVKYYYSYTCPFLYNENLYITGFIQEITHI